MPSLQTDDTRLKDGSKCLRAIPCSASGREPPLKQKPVSDAQRANREYGGIRAASRNARQALVAAWLWLTRA